MMSINSNDLELSNESFGSKNEVLLQKFRYRTKDDDKVNDGAPFGQNPEVKRQVDH